MQIVICGKFLEVIFPHHCLVCHSSLSDNLTTSYCAPTIMDFLKDNWWVVAHTSMALQNFATLNHYMYMNAKQPLFFSFSFWSILNIEWLALGNRKLLHIWLWYTFFFSMLTKSTQYFYTLAIHSETRLKCMVIFQ